MEETGQVGNKNSFLIENIILILLSVFSLLSLGLLIIKYNPYSSSPVKSKESIIGKVKNLKKPVKIKLKGSLSWEDIGDDIYANSAVMTGDNSFLQIEVDGQEIKIQENAYIEFKQGEKSDNTLHVYKGALDVNSKKKSNLAYAVNGNVVKVDKKDVAMRVSNFGANSSSVEVTRGEVKIKEGDLEKKLTKDMEVALKNQRESIKNFVKPLTPMIGERIVNQKDVILTWWHEASTQNRKAFILEISRSPKFEKVLRKKVQRTEYLFSAPDYGKYYWRVYLEKEGAKLSQVNYFILLEKQLINMKMPRDFIAGESKIRFEILEDIPLFYERSSTPDFRIIDRKVQITKKVGYIPIDFVNQKYIRIVDEKNRVVWGGQEINPRLETLKMKKMMMSDKEIKLMWSHVLKNIKDHVYTIKIKGENFSKEIVSRNPEITTQLGNDGVYNIYLYAHDAKDTPLLLKKTKLNYNKLKPVKLKEEIIIR